MTETSAPAVRIPDQAATATRAGLPIDVAPLSARDADELLTLDQWAFGFDPTDVDPQPNLDAFEWDRTFGARTPEGALAGMNTTYSLNVSVPGGDVPMAGLSWVGVHPGFRRRGVLSAMMRHHLDQVRERGDEAVSGLLAAEPAIYGRFGYGLATRTLHLSLGRGAQLRDVPGAGALRVALETVDAGRHAPVVNGCFEAVRATRPGVPSRSSRGLQRLVLDDPPRLRRGAEPLKLVTVNDDTGGVRGYALFRRHAEWGDGGPKGALRVREAAAVDAAAARALWGFLLDVDLISTVQTDARPPDDALLHLLVDMRAPTPRIGDGLWVRLVDLPRALASRTYSANLDAVLEVTDTWCPSNAGRWRLTGGTDGAACERTDDEPDVSLDVRELGAAWLGGESLAALAAAGLAHGHDTSRVDEIATAFLAPRAPWCGWVF